MKRIGKILSLAMIICMLATSFCFADTLTLENSYPADGSTGASIENLGVKLEFGGNMSASKAGKVNKDVFKLTDDEGNELPIRVLYPPKEAGIVLVLFDQNKSADIKVKGNSEYTLSISGELVDDNGNALGEDQTITFKTLNQNANTMINMVLMFVMFGGMMLFSTKSAKKAAEEAKAREREAKVNPYREAKRTGKSVEEIVEQTEKDKAKRAAKEARKAAKEKNDDEYDWIDINTYRVNGRKPVTAQQSKFVAKRKAEAEAKKAEARAAKEAHKKNYKKGKAKKK